MRQPAQNVTVTATSSVPVDTKSITQSKEYVHVQQRGLVCHIGGADSAESLEISKEQDREPRAATPRWCFRRLELLKSPSLRTQSNLTAGARCRISAILRKDKSWRRLCAVAIIRTAPCRQGHQREHRFRHKGRTLSLSWARSSHFSAALAMFRLMRGSH